VSGGYIRPTSTTDKLLVLTDLMMLNDREKVRIVQSSGRVGRRRKSGRCRDGGAEMAGGEIE
jgi:hypothetical protein